MDAARVGNCRPLRGYLRTVHVAGWPGGVVAALRRGDEQAFASLVDEYGPAMLRVARMNVAARAGAEEVVQDAWLGVISGIGRFEGRSSLKTWIFRILENTADAG